MKNFLFDENYLFLKPSFLRTIVTGSNYKDLNLKLIEKNGLEYPIKIDNIEEYIYKDKTLLIFDTFINHEKYILNDFIKRYLSNNLTSTYFLGLTNNDAFNTVFVKEPFKITKENFNFIFEKVNENEIKIKFYLLMN